MMLNHEASEVQAGDFMSDSSISGGDARLWSISSA